MFWFKLFIFVLERESFVFLFWVVKYDVIGLLINEYFLKFIKFYGNVIKIFIMGSGFVMKMI